MHYRPLFYFGQTLRKHTLGLGEQNSSLAGVRDWILLLKWTLVTMAVKVGKRRKPGSKRLESHHAKNKCQTVLH